MKPWRIRHGSYGDWLKEVRACAGGGIQCTDADVVSAHRSEGRGAEPADVEAATSDSPLGAEVSPTLP